MLHSWVKLPSVCQPRCEFFHLHISTSEALIKYITHTRSSWSQDERHSMCPGSLLEGSMCKCTVPSCGSFSQQCSLMPFTRLSVVQSAFRLVPGLLKTASVSSLAKLSQFNLHFVGLLGKRCKWRPSGRWTMDKITRCGKCRSQVQCIDIKRVDDVNWKQVSGISGLQNGKWFSHQNSARYQHSVTTYSDAAELKPQLLKM